MAGSWYSRVTGRSRSGITARRPMKPVRSSWRVLRCHVSRERSHEKPMLLGSTRHSAARRPLGPGSQHLQAHPARRSGADPRQAAARHGQSRHRRQRLRLPERRLPAPDHRSEPRKMERRVAAADQEQGGRIGEWSRRRSGVHYRWPGFGASDAQRHARAVAQAVSRLGWSTGPGQTDPDEAGEDRGCKASLKPGDHHMRRHPRWILLVAFLLSGAAVGEVTAQGTAKGVAGKTACALLSPADIKQITGRSDVARSAGKPEEAPFTSNCLFMGAIDITIHLGTQTKVMFVRSEEH